MTSKRHIVLYGIAALVLLTIATVFMYVRKKSVSDIPQELASATTSALTAPSVSDSRSNELVVAAKPFRFEIATTQAAHAKGLAGRADIPSDYGMLFVFSEKAKQSFWMKDMLTSIDIIWVSDEGVVVGIEKEVSPETYPKVFISPEPVRYVLETRAGEASVLGLRIGTKLNLPLPYGQTVSE